MLRFNELRIDSAKNLVIDVSVVDVTADTNRISVINHIQVGMGSNTELMEFCQESTIFDRIDGPSYDSMRGFRLTLPLKANNDYKKLLYIKVSVDTGVLDIPCTIKTYIEGMAYDKCLMMNDLLSYIKSSKNHCDNLNDYANYILQVKGLELAIEGNRFDLANKYWDTFFGGNTAATTHNCNCHE